MTIEEYVENQLGVPPTIVGFQYIVEAIEILCDGHTVSNLYKDMSCITNKSTRYLESTLRRAKERSYCTKAEEIFGQKYPRTIETRLYLYKAALFYNKERRTDEK